MPKFSLEEKLSKEREVFVGAANKLIRNIYDLVKTRVDEGGKRGGEHLLGISWEMDDSLDYIKQPHPKNLSLAESLSREVEIRNDLVRLYHIAGTLFPDRRGVRKEMALLGSVLTEAAEDLKVDRDSEMAEELRAIKKSLNPMGFELLRGGKSGPLKR